MGTVSKHVLQNHDPATGANPVHTGQPVLPIQDEGDGVSFPENIRALEQAYQKYTSNLLTVTTNMQKSAEKLVTCFDAADICDSFHQIFAKKLMGHHNELCSMCRMWQSTLSQQECDRP